MNIITNIGDRYKKPAFKDLAVKLFREGKSEREVFQNLQRWNMQIRETMDDGTLKNLVSGVKKERLKRCERIENAPWEISGDTVYRKLAEGFMGEQPFFYDRNRLWWMWDLGKCYWHMVDEIDLMVALDSWTKVESEKPAFRHGLMEALKKQGRRNEPKQAPKTWIQFQDTIVDIENMSQFQATPEYFMTNPIPWRLGESEDTPTIDKIFHDWTVGGDQDETYVNTLHEIAAFCLLMDYPLHRIICLIGTGCNGKGSFIRLLERFVGERNYTSSDIHMLSNRVFETAKLYRKLLCTIGEIDKAIFRKTSLLKRLTGQDTIGFEIKRKNPFDGHNYAKIVIATNTLPESTDK